MTGGYLLYKCRRCMEIEASVHVPDALVALICIIENMPMPKEWFGCPAPKMLNLHACDAEYNGVADLIGIQKDEDKENKE